MRGFVVAWVRALVGAKARGCEVAWVRRYSKYRPPAYEAPLSRNLVFSAARKHPYQEISWFRPLGDGVLKERKRPQGPRAAETSFRAAENTRFPGRGASCTGRRDFEFQRTNATSHPRAYAPTSARTHATTNPRTYALTSPQMVAMLRGSAASA